MLQTYGAVPHCCTVAEHLQASTTLQAQNNPCNVLVLQMFSTTPTVSLHRCLICELVGSCMVCLACIEPDIQKAYFLSLTSERLQIDSEQLRFTTCTLHEVSCSAYVGTAATDSKCICCRLTCDTLCERARGVEQQCWEICQQAGPITQLEHISRQQ